jgi:zinc and cadmium transporter
MHPAHRFSWLGTALGLGLHSLIDGVALGAAVRGAEAGFAGGLLGGGVFLAILLHKPLDAMSITALMHSGGWGRTALRRANFGFALLCPCGALAFYFGIDMLAVQEGYVVAAALAFAAGAFACIALGDLLPEVQFHSHDRVKLTLAFLAGIALAWLLGIFEPEAFHDAHGVIESGHRAPFALR